MNRMRFRFLLGCGAAACLLGGSAAAAAESSAFPERSAASDQPVPGVVRTPLPEDQSEGLTISRVFYDLRGRAGITGGDAEARRQLVQVASVKAGDSFTVAAASLALQKVQALGFVRSAGWRIYESEQPGYVVLVFSVEFGSRDGAVAGGMLSGRASDFPVLYRDEATLLRLQLDGGFGFYHDSVPWFGDAARFTARSPIAASPARGSGATWGEASAEYGLSGIRRLGRTPFWLYGSGTFLTSAAAGQDLFRNDAREMTRLEDLYAGFVVGSPEWTWSASLSAGRQNWQLHDGFLFSRFAAGANAGPYPALYLNPRTAYEMTVLGKIAWRDLRLEGFYLDPAELDFVDSGTKYTGVHLAYAQPRGLEAAVLWYRVPESSTQLRTAAGAAVPREGMRTFDLRLGHPSLFGIDGLELFGEHAWQTHDEADWEARAWYVRGGYTFRSLPWKPNLSYRYASFSGDDPDSDTYEGFDAQLSSGLDTWVQGVNAKKTVTNTNLNSHRVRLGLAASPRLSFTFDWWVLRADAGSGPRDYGQEVDLGIRWSIARNLFFLGVAGIAFPGDRLESQSGRELDTWTTAQASLFWNF